MEIGVPGSIQYGFEVKEICHARENLREGIFFVGDERGFEGGVIL